MKTNQSPISPPSQPWQERGKRFISDCQNNLQMQGNKALNWLRQRGLENETIITARLGYNPNDIYEPAKTWGLTGKKVYLPRGIVIPNEDDENLWGIRFRLPVSASEEQKHIAVRGTVPALYGAVNLSHEKPVVLVVGEFDALMIQQEVSAVAAIATGSTSWCRKTKWLALLARAPIVLIAYNNDDAGEKASAWWLEALGVTAKRWRPWWGDANAMYRDGANLQVWLAPALEDKKL